MGRIQVCSKIWIRKAEKSYLGNGRIKLLKNIQQEGSISKASKRMYMSYKSAWDNLNQMKALSENELVLSSNGGIGGGGTMLTDEGKKAICVFEALEELHKTLYLSFESCYNLDDLLEKIKKCQSDLLALREVEAKK